MYDTQGSSSQALAGAIALLEDEAVVGIVGTGYSKAAEAAATYCSYRRKPMISPGSTSLDLVDKADFPYFMRSIASDEQQMTSLAGILQRLGWRHIAIVYAEMTQATQAASRLPCIRIPLRMPSID